MEVTQPVQKVLTSLKALGCNPKPTSRGWESKCPAHDDRMPSLGIGVGDRGDALLKCAAGCTLDEICRALGMATKDLFEKPNTPPPQRQPKKPKTIHATLDRAISAAAFGISQRLEIPQGSLTFAGQWSYQNADGRTIAMVIRHNLPPSDGKTEKQFTPLHTEGEGWVLGDPRGAWPLYHLPEVARAIAKGQRVHFHEGEKAADALRTLGLTTTTTAHGAKSPHLTDFSVFANADEVVIFPDNDPPMRNKKNGELLTDAKGNPRYAGLEYAYEIARRIHFVGPLVKVRIVMLPELPPKGDAVEYLAARANHPDEAILADLDALIAASPILNNAAPPLVPVKEDTRPKIRITADEHIVVKESIAALAVDQNVFRREGMLVRTVRTSGLQHGVTRAGTMTIGVIPAPNIRERLASVGYYTKMNAKGDEVHAHPPDWLVSQVMERAEWPDIRFLAGVSDAPVLRKDGSICQTKGYDAATGVLYDPSIEMPAIPAAPTLANAQAAVGRLWEVVCDVPFETPEHLAAWVCALLTPLARFAFQGPSPCFLIDANVRGAGKGLLSDIIGLIVSGRTMPICSYVHENEEMKKIITSVAMAGDRTVLLDNITGNFGNSAMDALLTGETWKGRILGKNMTPEFEMKTVWYATGNNVMLSGDMCRRTVHIRIEVADEKPENRTGFKHANLRQWVAENRARLLADGLTILSAFIKAGAPGATAATFIEWQAVVRNAVMWVGLPDAMLTQRGLAESSDTDTDVLAQMLEAWANYCAYPPDSDGVLIPHLLANLYPTASRDGWPADATSVAMRSALETLAGSKSNQPPTAKQVGYKLRKYRGRWFGERSLNVLAGKNEEGRLWRLFGRTGTAPAPAPPPAPPKASVLFEQEQPV